MPPAPEHRGGGAVGEHLAASEENRALGEACGELGVVGCDDMGTTDTTTDTTTTDTRTTTPDPAVDVDVNRDRVQDKPGALTLTG